MNSGNLPGSSQQPQKQGGVEAGGRDEETLQSLLKTFSP